MVVVVVACAVAVANAVAGACAGAHVCVTKLSKTAEHSCHSVSQSFKKAAARRDRRKRKERGERERRKITVIPRDRERESATNYYINVRFEYSTCL